MKPISPLLTDTQTNGVHDLRGRMAVLDGRNLPDKAALLFALGEALAFPEYYGQNWDALEECLTDMSWCEGAIVLAIIHADALPAEALATLSDIFTDAAAFWREHGRVCKLLLV